MTTSFLLDLLTVQLPASPEEVEAWAGVVSAQLPVSASDPGLRCPTSPAWRAQLCARWPQVQGNEPLAIWVQVLAYVWASDPAPIHGSVERALVHWWPRVAPHSWPSAWPASALEMALELGWQILPEVMLRQPKAGWSVPVFTEALRRRLGVSGSQFDALKGVARQAAPKAGWQHAGQATTVADLSVLQGQDVTVPAPDAAVEHPEWPELHWHPDHVKAWPAMHTAMADLRVVFPSAQAQHTPAGRALIVRALALGEWAVAHQLGWTTWLRSGEPLVFRKAPHTVDKSVLDGLAQGQRLERPEHLGGMLDQVFQAAHTLHRPAHWLLPDEVELSRSSALRFWGRALNSGFAAIKPRRPPSPGRREPAWWRFLMQERSEIWYTWWRTLAPTAPERWQCWWNAVQQRVTALNPWQLLAVAELPAARAILGGSLWEILSPEQESVLVKECLDRLLHDATANVDRWKQADVRWAMVSVARRWCPAPQSAPWVPLVWAWLSAQDMAAPSDLVPAARLARPWWRRLDTWVKQNPAAALQVDAQNTHRWALIGHPVTEARWRALLGQIQAPQGVIRRQRQRA